MLRVAISGFGRIGKAFLKAAIEQKALGKDFDVVVINTRSAPEMHAYLFKYDSALGKFNGKVEVKDDSIVIDGYEIKWLRETEPEKLPWTELKIDLVLESSGKFKSREDIDKHLTAGAKKVLISAPGKGCDATIVPGVNDEKYNKEMKVISLASCTTNCLAPVLKVMDEKFGIEKGFLSTIHAYTNDQRLIDGSHKDWRRGRAGAVSIIPTTTGAAKAIGQVLPQLEGKLDGVAFRVPIPDGSMNDITLLLKKETTTEEVNTALKEAAEGELKGILRFSEEPLVSIDIVGTSESAK